MIDTGRYTRHMARLCPDCRVEKPLADFYPDRAWRRTYCIPCTKVRVAKFRADRPDKVREMRQKANRRALYDIEPAEWDALYAKQDGRCAICREPERLTQRGRERALSTDHDHATGRVRGLLCNNCNRGIGNLGDCPERLRQAATYLEDRA